MVSPSLDKPSPTRESLGMDKTVTWAQWYRSELDAARQRPETLRCLPATLTGFLLVFLACHLLIEARLYPAVRIAPFRHWRWDLEFVRSRHSRDTAHGAADAFLLSLVALATRDLARASGRRTGSRHAVGDHVHRPAMLPKSIMLRGYACPRITQVSHLQ
jgi:hypothetical protein